MEDAKLSNRTSPAVAISKYLFSPAQSFLYAYGVQYSATIFIVMGNRALMRPLVHLAKHELAFARTASRSNQNSPEHRSSSQHFYTPIPDFFLPASVTKEYHTCAISHRHRTPFPTASAIPGHPNQRRMFSASPAAKAVVVTANPRKDEDGNEMLIDITARAAKVCSCHPLHSHRPMTADYGSSVSKKSCPRTLIPILLYESQSSQAGVMAFNTSCLLTTPLQYLPKMIQYSSQAIVRGQRLLWTSLVWSY